MNQVEFNDTNNAEEKATERVSRSDVVSMPYMIAITAAAVIVVGGILFFVFHSYMNRTPGQRSVPSENMMKAEPENIDTNETFLDNISDISTGSSISDIEQDIENTDLETLEEEFRAIELELQ
jgi:hypothetical protein